MGTKTASSKFAGYKNAHEEFVRNPGKGRARALKMKCLECVNFEDVRERIQNCNATSCSLHSFRPFQRKSLQVVE